MTGLETQAKGEGPSVPIGFVGFGLLGLRKMGSPLSDRVSDRAELDFPLARRNTCLGAIFASNFAFGLAFGGLSPLISLTLESQGITEFLIGINSAIGAVGVACFAPLAPKLFIRYGAGIPLFACSILFIGAIA
ncbi:MAG: hypothetical protein H8E30_13095, partial [Alphaproteobacteria bacterium]|nr:hypothetical protein [Alphaproteobacteria bacterium]